MLPLRLRNSFIALGVAVTVTACGGSITGTNSGDQLTALEAQAVLDAFAAAFDSIGTGGAAMRTAVPTNGINADIAPAVMNFDNSVSFNMPCHAGSVAVAGSVNGSVNDQTFAMNMGMDFTWDPQACVVPHETLTFTLDGAPKIQFKGDMTLSETLWSLTGTETGGFSFTSSDGRSGSCAIDLNFSVSVDSAFVETVQVTGSVCGVDASQITPL